MPAEHGPRRADPALPRLGPSRREALLALPTPVLYDVSAESANQRIAHLLDGLEDRSPAEQQQVWAAVETVRRTRHGADPEDRDRIVDLIEKWEAAPGEPGEPE